MRCANHAGAGGGVVSGVDEDEAAGGAAVAVEIREKRTAGLDDDLSDVVEYELLGGMMLEMFDVNAGAEFDVPVARTVWLVCFRR